MYLSLLNYFILPFFNTFDVITPSRYLESRYNRVSMVRLTLANLNNFSSGQYWKYKRNRKIKLLDAEKGCKKVVYTWTKELLKQITEACLRKGIYFLYKSGKEKVPWKDCQVVNLCGCKSIQLFPYSLHSFVDQNSFAIICSWSIFYLFIPFWFNAHFYWS